MPLLDGFEFDPPDVGDGIGGIILSIILWLIITVLFTFLLYILGSFSGLSFCCLQPCCTGFFSVLCGWYLKIQNIAEEIF
jgi:hypothetical protein